MREVKLYCDLCKTQIINSGYHTGSYSIRLTHGNQTLNVYSTIHMDLCDSCHNRLVENLENFIADAKIFEL